MRSLVSKFFRVKSLEREKRKPGEASWMKTVSAGGTVGDKIAALVLQIQESPLHNLKNLEILLSKVERNNRREALLAAGKVLNYVFLCI